MYFGVLFVGREGQEDIPQKVIKCFVSSKAWELCEAGGPYGGFRDENLALCNNPPRLQNLGTLDPKNEKRILRILRQLDVLYQLDQKDQGGWGRFTVGYAFISKDQLPLLEELHAELLRQGRLDWIIRL